MITKILLSSGPGLLLAHAASIDLWPNHRCFSHTLQEHSEYSTGDYLVPDPGEFNDQEVTGDGAANLWQNACRAIFIGSTWLISSRRSRERTRRVLGHATTRWNCLVNWPRRSPSAPAVAATPRQGVEKDARRMTKCRTEPNLRLHLPTLLQSSPHAPGEKEGWIQACEDDSDVEMGHRRPMTKRKTEPPMSKPRTLIEQSGWSPSPSNISRLRKRSQQTPSFMELEEIYDATVPQSCSAITLETLKDVVKVLNQRYSVDFQAGDANRLYAMMNINQRGATRSAFIDTVYSLLRALKSSKLPLSFAQLRLIMGTAFERFDVNADGDLSLEEFQAALLSFDYSIGIRETKILLQFLSQESGTATVLNKEDFQEGAASLEENCLAAVAKAKDKVAEFTGWRSAVAIKDKVGAICFGEGDLQEKAKRLQATLQAEQVADSTELALTLASLALVFLNNPAHAVGQQMAIHNMAEVQTALNSLSSSFAALLQSAPMGPIMLSALLAGSKAMRRKDLVALGGNEALLYVQSFQAKGCSLSFFHKLLSCSSYRWGQAMPGDYLLLNSKSPELKILLHGKGRRGSKAVPPGAVLMKRSEDDRVLVEEQITYIAWDVRKLTELITHTKDPALVKLVRDMIQEADPGFMDFDPKASERPENVNGLLAAMRDAIELQAKRKGLAMCYQLAEGLQRLILNSQTSQREKMNQCQVLIMESADDLMEGVEALADFAGAFSALAAISTHANDGVSTDDVLQLAPLFILASLTVGKSFSLRSEEEQQ